jgi:hypothetical protein
MFITVTKWFSIASLIAAFFDSDVANRPLLMLVIFAGAILVTAQVVRARVYMWASGFVLLAVLFNPFTTIAFSSTVLRWLEIVCIASFLVSLWILRPAPSVSIPSITNLKSRSESL